MSSLTTILIRELERKITDPIYTFEFRAYNICNEKYEQCFDIWGEGTFNFNQVVAQGNYMKYKEDTTKFLESAWWCDTDFIYAPADHIIVKAEQAVKRAGLAGFIVIEVFEGKTTDTGKVCESMINASQ
ncbi:MAG: hypothetical protein QXU32_12285 [Nitrososphaerales archaeon]